MTLRLAALAQGRALRVAALAQGRALRVALLAQGRTRLSIAGARQAVTTAAVVLIGGGASVFAACPQCFGAEETTLIGGTKLGVAVLLAVTLAVQGGFVAFFLYLRNRARRMAEVELDTEWSDLQRASRTS